MQNWVNAFVQQNGNAHLVYRRSSVENGLNVNLDLMGTIYMVENAAGVASLAEYLINVEALLQ